MAGGTLLNGRSRFTPAVSPPPTIDYAMPDLGGLWRPNPVLLPNGWGVSLVSVGPELAAAMLATNRDDNRNKRPTVHGRYANDMRQGLWRLTHQGVAFDRQGHLCDGQHRLSACVQAGAEFETLVFFGVGDGDEMGVLDTGANRSASDASAYILGTRTGHKVLATLRSFLTGGSGQMVTYSHPHILAYLSQMPAFGLFHARTFVGRAAEMPNGAVRAAVMRAFFHHDPDDLTRFVAMVMDKENPTEKRDHAARLLRRYLAGFAGGRGGIGASTEMYRKGQRAILAYLTDEHLDKLYASADDLFPLPTAEQVAARNASEAALLATIPTTTEG